MAVVQSTTASAYLHKYNTTQLVNNDLSDTVTTLPAVGLVGTEIALIITPSSLTSN